MANTTTNRFENTVIDLLDCYKHMEDELSESEEKAKRKIIRLCNQIIVEYGDSKKKTR